ncbi:alpha/beta fold hydrolase [Flavobacterium faecale]|uniref:alpha/beta fold hydrolase n=1 Tax=Flavobacterium faecale TaxID=1355330 RepID=UPI003AAAC6F2
MESKPTIITINNFTTESGANYPFINLSFQVFGQELHTAPIVLINHALTGNSNIIGENGWWNDLVGEQKTIDTDKYSILAFNVPGNGYDGVLLDNYLDFNARDVARLFVQGVAELNIEKLYAIVGGSVGGGIAWEMLMLAPKITHHLVPIATDWKSTDWLIANCFLQEQILNNSSRPIEDARIHAMLCYRTPESFKVKFQRTTNEELAIFNIESWLQHHGNKLQKRFQLSSYKLMNQLLKTIDVTRGRGNFDSLLDKVEANIHIVGINSDLFFTAKENKETYDELIKHNVTASYSEIISVHGHDAFLIEYEQLNNLLAPIF